MLEAKISELPSISLWEMERETRLRGPKRAQGVSPAWGPSWGFESTVSAFSDREWEILTAPVVEKRFKLPLPKNSSANRLSVGLAVTFRGLLGKSKGTKK